MSSADANSILKAFKIKYPKRYPTVMFKMDGGYLLEAPLYKNKVDYEDPYYFISEDLKDISRFNMSNLRTLFEIFKTNPVWVRSD